MDSGIFRLIVTSVGRLLLEIYRNHGETVSWAELRREYGSKIYQQVYPLALHGLVAIEGEGRGRTVKITTRGLGLISCILKCFEAAA